MQKWEHLRLVYRLNTEGLMPPKIVPNISVLIDGNYKGYKGEDAINYLDALGNDGWELVSVTAPTAHAVVGGGSLNEVLWFKRPKE